MFPEERTGVFFNSEAHNVPIILYNTKLHYMRKKLFLILAMLLSAIISFAQNVGISGTVVDSNGEPLIGVSVIVKGTTTGTMTDLDGKFSLNVPSDAVIEISSIGYVTQSMPVGSTRVFNITLADDNEMLRS